MARDLHPLEDFENTLFTLRWRHNDHAGVSNHQPQGCLLNRLFRRKSKKTSKLRVTGLCVGNSPGTGEFPAQMASYAENVSIWWRHHDWRVYRIRQLCIRIQLHVLITASIMSSWPVAFHSFNLQISLNILFSVTDFNSKLLCCISSCGPIY